MELLAAIQQLQAAAEAAHGVLADIEDATAVRARLADEIRSMTEHKAKAEAELVAVLEAVQAAQAQEAAVLARVANMKTVLAGL